MKKYMLKTNSAFTPARRKKFFSRLNCYLAAYLKRTRASAAACAAKAGKPS